ncbi:non-hydrolyzing UDP-N-acetylglucosamine 2-epimerase [Nitrococcus mobilis]|uniref:UDP-N-acetylglucosamine 2-epimerase n=1 Tax=Nitrococcus mobilis Nb-231 TaxID=314278 RepID=A4BSK3_9GAMM|nr:UDP-N-acetylglucosamine 2-epimerase (non-hydrolyzing) [Nitrococcus mobilis]EAR21273.1 UDP-N-acetylglucosamine 2-epimerase [Nitrococcus mobilis Nb-231]
MKGIDKSQSIKQWTVGSASLPEVLCVIGARPNYMKMAPLLEAFARAQPRVPTRLVHTGQHYDMAMNDQHFQALDLPMPEIALGVGSGSHAVQTAEIMRRFEPVVDEFAPGAVLVVGDVNSTVACALVAAKKGVPVFHVEAGLRSFDRTMPEEINRVLTDQLAELLFTTEAAAAENLAREGISMERVHFAGNVMIDSVLRHIPRAIPADQTLSGQCLSGYALVTLHRPSNVDDPEILCRLLQTLAELAERLPVVFPVHPRTRARVEAIGQQGWFAQPGVHALPPLDYLAMLGLLREARCVLTDSGGLQEETTALGIPCLTLRENTERPITVEQGTNTVVGTDSARILANVEQILASGGKSGRVPERWDGHAAERIAKEVALWLKKRQRRTA